MLRVFRLFQFVWYRKDVAASEVGYNTAGVELEIANNATNGDIC